MNRPRKILMIGLTTNMFLLGELFAKAHPSAQPARKVTDDPADDYAKTVRQEYPESAAQAFIESSGRATRRGAVDHE